VTTTYLAGTALAELDRLHTELYAHLITDPNGRCHVCHQIEPCHRRGTITQTILGYGLLPRRVPGATTPPATHRSGTPGRSWFD